MPQLVKCCSQLKNGITLAVYTSHCIVTRPPENKSPTPPSPRNNKRFSPSALVEKYISKTPIRALVNPANEELIGTYLPYFPMAGPPPKDLYTTSWGGLTAGEGMFYPMQTVDGVLSLHGGADLRTACRQLPVHKDVELIGGGGNPSGGYGTVRCPVGCAVVTKSFGDAVTKHFSYIVHTVPPLWSGNGGSKHSEAEARDLLISCYSESVKTAFNVGASIITLPLIGTGARRAPLSEAIDCSVVGVLNAINIWYDGSKNRSIKRYNGQGRSEIPPTVEIVVLELKTASKLVDAIDNAF